MAKIIHFPTPDSDLLLLHIELKEITPEDLASIRSACKHHPGQAASGDPGRDGLERQPSASV